MNSIQIRRPLICLAFLSNTRCGNGGRDWAEVSFPGEDEKTVHVFEGSVIDVAIVTERGGGLSTDNQQSLHLNSKKEPTLLRKLETLVPVLTSLVVRS